MDADGGPYYIYEKGQLRTSSGKPFLPAKRLKIEPQDFAVTKPFYDANDTSTNDGLHTAPSLLKITITFVSDNLHLVESLVGFPELVGELLFEAASSRNKFKEIKSMNLFSEAYGTCVLSEVRIGSQTFLDKILGSFHGLHLLVKLDLSGCQIGDNHEMLKVIGQEFTRYVCGVVRSCFLEKIYFRPLNVTNNPNRESVADTVNPSYYNPVNLANL